MGRSQDTGENERKRDRKERETEKKERDTEKKRYRKERETEKKEIQKRKRERKERNGFSNSQCSTFHHSKLFSKETAKIGRRGKIPSSHIFTINRSNLNKKKTNFSVLNS